MVICGIYKITNPSNRIYIGQSKNINKRVNCYKNKRCNGQILLFNSLNKYGFENHKLEVIENCTESQLDEREIYYINLFQTFNTKNGLNLKNGGKYGTHSNETRRKLSISNTGNTHTEETKRRISKSMTGRETSDETRKKLSIANTGKKASEETRIKLSVSHKGNKHTEESKIKIGIGSIGNTHRIKIILNTETGIFYFGAEEVAPLIHINPVTLRAKLRGKIKNNTPFIYA
mgnify:CR=1 FL=1